jgi:hypothetical protein
MLTYLEVSKGLPPRDATIVVLLSNTVRAIYHLTSLF